MYKTFFLLLFFFTPEIQADVASKTGLSTDNTKRIKHDPTEPLSWLKAKPRSQKKVQIKKNVPLLQAITCDEFQHCYAVLDNQIFTKNDVVSGYIISSITENDVSIKRAGKQRTLSLFSKDIKN